MRLTWIKWSALPAAVLLAGSVAMAQDQPAPNSQPAPQAQSGSSATAATPATPAAKPKPAVGQRKENQQDRIAQGVQSKQLTAGETANLETKEAAINGETKADRAANGGKLTAAEKKHINGQQNQLSKQIYKDAQGVKSGQLTAGETAKLENQQKGINQQVAADRKANGGTLLASEKKQVNKEQNAASKNIYRKKHNAKTSPQAQPKP